MDTQRHGTESYSCLAAHADNLCDQCERLSTSHVVIYQPTWKNKPISLVNDDQCLEVQLQTRWSKVMSYLIRLVDPHNYMYYSIVDPKRLP